MLYGNPKATDEEIIEALKSANAWDFLSGELSTSVGNAGG
jgi:ABC-type multidrug transport system fused ATPase/permease subunit